MAAKADLHDLRSTVTQETRVAIPESVDTLKDEMASIRARVGRLEVTLPAVASRAHVSWHS
eukprot:14463293-Alexandrium_andersonii.AAC.1